MKLDHALSLSVYPHTASLPASQWVSRRSDGARTALSLTRTEIIVKSKDFRTCESQSWAVGLPSFGFHTHGNLWTSWSQPRRNCYISEAGHRAGSAYTLVHSGVCVIVNNNNNQTAAAAAGHVQVLSADCGCWSFPSQTDRQTEKGDKMKQ